ncbi:hypothetical protein D3C75_1089220 [compost metagenome]
MAVIELIVNKCRIDAVIPAACQLAVTQHASRDIYRQQLCYRLIENPNFSGTQYVGQNTAFWGRFHHYRGITYPPLT